MFKNYFILMLNVYIKTRIFTFLKISLRKSENYVRKHNYVYDENVHKLYKLKKINVYDLRTFSSYT